MSTVDKLIFDALAKRQNVVLPGIGSLEVKRRPAKKISEGRIIPPQNVVAFTTDEIAGGESVVSMLAGLKGNNREEAENSYKSWLEGARKDDGITINDVGELRGGKFVVAQRLHSELNPASDEVIVMENERNIGPLWAWILGGLLVAALIVGGLTCWKCGWFDKSGGRPVETTKTAVAPAEQQSAVTEPATAAAPEYPAEERYHIIAGAFMIEKNADNYIKMLQEQYPELTIEKIYNPANGYNMVSILHAPTSRQAYNKIPLYWDIDLGIWVYKEK